MEQPARLRDEHDRHDRAATGRLPEDRHPAGVPAERRDVVADPFEPRNHVQQAVVPGCAVRRLGGQGRVGQEAEDIEAVVDGDHHRPVRGERRPVVYGGRSGAAGVAAAVNPEQHRPRLCRLARRPDVEEQAVLVLGDVLAAVLDADDAGLRRIADPVPADDRGRRAPAQVADRRRGEGDSLERDDIGVAGRHRAPDRPARDGDRRLGIEDGLGTGRHGHDDGEDQRRGSAGGDTRGRRDSVRAHPFLQARCHPESRQ